MDMEAELTYFNCIGGNYDKIKNICKQVCIRNKEQFSEDILNDTVIQIHKIILKKGKLNDMTCSGITNYFVRSYVNNLRCEKRYAYIQKRDTNITKEEFQERHEQQQEQVKNKILKDMLEDFSILFIMKQVELNFSQEHFYLYKLKMLCKMTYKQIHDKTHIKKSRDKILEVNKWVKDNLSRDIIKKEFNSIYEDIID